MAKSMTEGPYKRGVKTQVGGYWEKLFLRAFQHLTLGPHGVILVNFLPEFLTVAEIF
jgi:hypothetical protein